MRYTAVILVFLLTSLFLSPAHGQAKPDVSANNAILMEQSTGRVLFEKQADQEQSIASITKIMTAIVAIESGKLDETVTISHRAVNATGSSIYLEEDEKMKLNDLIYGLLLRSGNDAAVAISEHIGGSMEGFVRLMNQKAAWLGMTHTSFANPHGLDAEGHYSTARDMALLMRYAMDNDIFRQVTETTKYKSNDRAYAWQNKHKLLTGKYDDANGGKTGFTRTAGRTLVSSAKRDDMELIAVTLDDPDDWRDHINLFNWGFSQYTMTPVDQKGSSIYQIAETGDQVNGYLHQDVTLPLNDKEQGQIESQSFVMPKDTQTTEDVIGKTIYFVDAVPIQEVSIHDERHKAGILEGIVTLYQKLTGFDPHG
ncbi:D-alanyl-D-alanine carboxypeptidase DacB [Barrientosiimonas marina]|uniref:D-alanyl-D-alanine carboxypeptidase family protein n=1 Tax=Lentibacillus kimchii TaxID=1542911 RepID=A0ABW2V1N0_9BACI